MALKPPGPAVLERPAATVPETPAHLPPEPARPVSSGMGRRVRLIGLLMALPFLSLWWSYGRVEWRLPSTPQAAPAVPRGRVLLADGTVLAESVNGKRGYPQGTLAGQLVGFEGTDRGLEGLEHFQEARLRAGRDVVLGLDPVFQAAAEAGLERAVLEHEAEAGSVVALETGTGRVLAVANYPRLNPNRWAEYPASHWSNRALRNRFEPGSTVKALVAAALVNEGLATPETMIDTPMHRVVARHFINDTVKHPERLDLTGILRYSSNVGISTLAERLTPKRLHAYLSAYGFGRVNGPGGVSVARGQLHDWQGWRATDRASASFGQGLSTTTMGLATAFSVLANDGRLVPPWLVKGEPRGEPTRVLSPSTARATRRMLRTVVEEGLPQALAIPGYCVGGKTGTAQVAIGGRYSDTVYGSLFAGFFPCESPRVTMVVEVYNARKGGHHGSQVAAPAFRGIAEEVLAHWGVAPSPPPPAPSEGQ